MKPLQVSSVSRHPTKNTFLCAVILVITCFCPLHAVTVTETEPAPLSTIDSLSPAEQIGSIDTVDGVDSVKNGVVTEGALPTPLIATPSSDALLKLGRARNLAVSGTVLLASSFLLEYLVINPWSERVMKKYSYADSRSDTLNSLGDLIGVAVASIPVGYMKIAGSTLACAGASRAYGTYQGDFDRSAEGIHIWKPYVAGWVLGVVSTACGFIGGFADSDEFKNTAYVVGIGRDVTWSVASIWSLVYTVQTADRAAENTSRVRLIPFSEKGYGFTLNIDM